MGCGPWGRKELDTTERLPFHFSLPCIGEGNGNPLQCSCLENPRDRGAWWAAVYGVAQSRTRLKRLSSSRGKSVNGRISEMTWQLIYLVKTEGTSSLVAQMVKNSSVMQETWVQSLGREDPLEKEMATHSSNLAWKIPWTEEPGRLQSMGSHTVGHN